MAKVVLSVPVEEDRIKALRTAATALGLSLESLAGALLSAELDHTPNEIAARACFERGWRGQRDHGALKMGPKLRGFVTFKTLVEKSGWEATDVLARWGRFVKAHPPKYLPEVWKIFAPSEGRLTDDALSALERARGVESKTQKSLFGTAEFEQDAYDERIARARRASDPIPRPSAGATRPALAGGPPAAPQAPAPVRP